MGEDKEEGEEVMDDLVKRLRGWYDASADEIHEEAADAIESLLRQSSLTRKLAIEEAAKVCEDVAKSADDLAADALKRNDRDAVTINCTQQALAMLLAANLRALSPSINEAEMVERAARAMVDLDILGTLDRKYWLDQATAVLRTLGITTEEGTTSEN